MQENMIMYNRFFVENELYAPRLASKKPAKKTAILTCMDTRLTNLLSAALGLKDGDAKIIRNAGGLVLNEYDTTIRSLLVAILQFDIKYLAVIGHTDCGVSKLAPANIQKELIDRGISQKVLDDFSSKCSAFADWFTGFNTIEEEVKKSVRLLRNHPLMPKEVSIHGYVMETETGALSHVL
ncbi:carbonic anhydrase [Lachnospiraceae bacterium PM6-15]|uniref:beta-class carbonic anhydrase n=1 Tax=Ohessyouella blattaphilus TaxID=2949333 RepID=UPI00256BE5FC|nr:carbonic anhydrase [Lachnospiraceae bacterium OttesenSCG-928-J05]